MPPNVGVDIDVIDFGNPKLRAPADGPVEMDEKDMVLLEQDQDDQDQKTRTLDSSVPWLRRTMYLSTESQGYVSPLIGGLGLFHCLFEGGQLTCGCYPG